MAAGLADRFENEGAQLLGEPLQPAAVELAQRRRIVDGLQQLVRARIVFGRSGSRPFAGQIRLSDSAHEGQLSVNSPQAVRWGLIYSELAQDDEIRELREPSRAGAQLGKRGLRFFAQFLGERLRAREP